jgi:hypothetical protein
MPLGVGSLIYVANVLPFAYFLWYLPWGPRRGQILAMNYSQNTRFYYKRWWVRMFFGRAQYTLYTLYAMYLLATYIGRQRSTNDLDFVAFYHDLDLYDAEESDKAKRVLDSYLYKKRINETRDLVLKGRAEVDRELKIEAFDKYALENNL